MVWSCVSEIPNMKETYEKYKDKGVAFVSISLDKSKDAWKKMIKEKGMTWYHANMQWGEKDNKFLKAFNVTSIPSVFILDPNGKVVAMGLRGEMLGKRLEEFVNKGNK